MKKGMFYLNQGVITGSKEDDFICRPCWLLLRDDEVVASFIYYDVALTALGLLNNQLDKEHSI